MSTFFLENNEYFVSILDGQSRGDQSMLSRRESRRVALQVLFAAEFLDEDIQEVARKVSESLEVELTEFSWELVQKTHQHKEELDKLIQEHLRNWDLHRISVLDHVLVRMALAEMLYFPDIPIEVTINEALEIGKDFCSLKSCRFINGILDAIYKDLRQKNILIKNIPKRPRHSHTVKKGKQW